MPRGSKAGVPGTRPIALIGPMAVGKSTIGQELAQQLRVPFVDTDVLIVEAHGSIASIFAGRGEHAFREIEARTVAAAVEQLAKPPAVAQPVPDIPPQSPLFEQYEENLRKNEQQQALDNARNSLRNQSNPKCQFWLQQDQTAPTEKSRANVLQFCD